MVVLIINEKDWPPALKRNNLKWEKWKNWNILRQTTTITTNIRAQLTFFAAPSEP